MKPALIFVMFFTVALAAPGPDYKADKLSAYLGFDRNDYPRDENLPALRRTFAYSGYWLNAPPGETATSWSGKRKALMRAGFGFLVLFTGRTDAQIKSTGDAKILGKTDADATLAAARREGFPPGTIIFLDQEEGGRLLPEQRDYLFAWIDGINGGGFRAGVYCSAIPFKEAGGDVVVTAEDIRSHAAGRTIAYWVSNDSCPPSPGCALAKTPLPPKASGVKFASVWQFAQSPRRASVADHCHTKYDSDGNCYAPGFKSGQHMFVDLNSATSSDPSRGRPGRQ